MLLLMCLGGLMNVGSGGGGTSATAGSSTSTISTSISSTPVVDPKETLLRDVKLDFKWHKEGFGNIMVADFTVKNPTQYRFKDF
jgi:hypothetical protein